MSEEKFEDRKKRLLEISEIVAKFPESLQERVFDELVSKSSAKVVEHKQQKNNKPSTSSITKKAQTKNRTYTIVNSLDLSGKDCGKSLKSFVDEKDPSGLLKAQNLNPVIVYYLRRIANVDVVGENHLYTCYKELEKNVPSNIDSNLRNNAKRKGHIFYDKEKGSWDVTTIGENYVERKLPEKKK